MDPSGFNPAFPFPVPTTGSVNLHHHHQQPMADLSLPPDPEVMKEANTTLNENTAAPGGHSAHRKRGRPRKLKPTTDPNFQDTVVEPPVSEVNDAPVTKEAVADVVPEKRVARPVKHFGADMVRKDVVRKNKKIINKAVLRGPLGYPKRGPGRPPKSRSVTDVFHGPVKTLAVAGIRKRGRPKRLLSHKLETVAPKVIGWGSGKAGSQVLGPVDPQWMVDYAHVRAKIDHIQSRMREAIGVIKPQLMNQVGTNGHIGTALRELDQISTMDVMAVSLSGPVEEPQAPAETQGPAASRVAPRYPTLSNYPTVFRKTLLQHHIHPKAEKQTTVCCLVAETLSKLMISLTLRITGVAAASAPPLASKLLCF